MKHQSGFTLMELLIAIMIIGLLAAIAIPSYQRYINKTRATAAIVLTGPARLAVDEHAILNNGNLNDISNDSLHLPSTQLVGKSSNVKSIVIQGISNNTANIIATLQDHLGTLTWVGDYSSDTGGMSWSCTYPAQSPIANYAPKNCRVAA